ncbi:putative amidase C550.07 [Aspergillus lentulus]|uniref:amidase n=1 Tax=Aspergillus lentulus TaxID=293939 RepID=A0AAN4PPY8_ASPLE|nr:putative amidase C550.07 [Aspergillus lentulus]
MKPAPSSVLHGSRRHTSWMLVLQRKSIGTIRRSLATQVEHSTAFPDDKQRHQGKERVVILGSGWGGYSLSRRLSSSKFAPLIISPRSYFVFTPLLTDAAGGSLDFSNIVEPVRDRRAQVDFIQAAARAVDFDRKTILCEATVVKSGVTESPRTDEAGGVISAMAKRQWEAGETFTVPYDKLVIAVGTVTKTFNTPGVRENALFFKDIGDARRMRKWLLHFAIVGAGPTGTELAASLRDFIYRDLMRLYPSLEGIPRITLYDVAPTVLSMFDERLAAYAMETMKKEGITIKTSHHVAGLRWGEPGAKPPYEMDPKRCLTLTTKEEGEVGVGMCVWATGNKMNEFIRNSLEEVDVFPSASAVAKGEKIREGNSSWKVKKGPNGALLVDGRLRVQLASDNGQTAILRDVFALGDNAMPETGAPPATAQATFQEAKWLAARLNADDIEQAPPFSFRNMGTLAYIGDARALMQLPHEDGQRYKYLPHGLTGRMAWLVWNSAYLTMSISWRNRLRVAYTNYINCMTKMAYAAISQRKLAETDAKIPSEWRLSESQIPPGMLSPAESITNVKQYGRVNVMDIPRTCGLLSARELEITEQYDVRGLLRAMTDKRLTAEEVTTAFCKRAAIAHQLTRCLTEPLFDRAIQRARELDAHLHRTGRPIGPLHGLPVSVKDCFNVKGIDTSIGIAALVSRPATEDAPLIQLLTALGAIVLTKTNVPQTMGALDSANFVFGRTLNPLNRALTAGGSSGGEGVLVAMRGCMVGFGTDIGGSIRVPAMCMGVYGFKPSVGRVPFGGQEGGQVPGKGRIALQAVAGPIARSVEDLGAVMAEIVPRAEMFGEDCIPGLWGGEFPRSGLRRKVTIGVLRSDGVVQPLPPVARVLDEVAHMLRRTQGVEVVEIPVLPALSKCQGLAGRLMGVDDGSTMLDLLEATGEPLIPWLQGRVKRGKALSVVQLAQLQAQRSAVERELLAMWMRDGNGDGDRLAGRQVDAIILPVAPHPVPEIDRYNAVGYSSSFVLLDYPAGVIPVRKFRETDLELGKEMTAPVLGSWDKANRLLWNEKTVDRRVYLDSPLSIQVVTPKQHDYELYRAMEIIDRAVRAEEHKTVAKL